MSIDGEHEKQFRLTCTSREIESMKQMLQQLVQIDNKKLEGLLKLMPHEVNDVKYCIRRNI